MANDFLLPLFNEVESKIVRHPLLLRSHRERVRHWAESEKGRNEKAYELIDGRHYVENNRPPLFPNDPSEDYQFALVAAAHDYQARLTDTFEQKHIFSPDDFGLSASYCLLVRHCEEIGKAEIERLNSYLEIVLGVLSSSATQPLLGETNKRTTVEDRGPLTVQKQIMLALNDDPQRQYWTAKQWAEYLSCSPGTVKSTKMWKTMMGLREEVRNNRRRDHN
jgi:hypothetical protein